MTDRIPGTPAKFLRWLKAHKAEWPADLYLLGEDTHRALAMIYMNRRTDAHKAAKLAAAPYLERWMAALLAHQVKVPLRVIAGGKGEKAS